MRSRLFLMSLLILISWNGDSVAASDAQNQATLDQLFKKWQVDEVRESISDGMGAESRELKVYSPVPDLLQHSITFEANGSFSDEFNGGSGHGSWSYNAVDSMLTLEYNSAKNNRFGRIQVWDLMRLTDSQLQISHPVRESGFKYFYQADAVE